MSEATNATFFLRHEFAIRRLHSLLGVVPIGTYMVVHLLTNASLLNGPATFQRLVNQIHALGVVLPVVEWGLIFLPLLFHGLLGVWFVYESDPNSDRYRWSGNRRYTWQRWTGLLALVFIFVHVFHLHGWFHFNPWVRYVAEPLGMAQFRAYNATSTLVAAMEGFLWPAFYLVGVTACVYHLANGLWTAGITWGLWVSASAQRRAVRVCWGFGLVLLAISLAAWWGAISTDAEEAIAIENRMYEAGVQSGMVVPAEHKRAQPDPLGGQ